MRVTTKGQVTIPQHIRKKLGITPNTEIDFAEENGRVYLTRKTTATPRKNRFRRFRGIATVKMSTLKAYLVGKGQSYPITNDLFLILQKILPINKDAENLRDALSWCACDTHALCSRNLLP
ncbi:MAG: AbrB/MazE/SpoVT family DNA-binding domain-containing protein [Thermodesulfovibrionales bacterium]|nr:AbrB/MazE/SpoVT family DNA-binding domain-containing protein [Thermodesulfovibrionales bacterium]